MKVGLISCVSKKKEGEHKAENLYDSPLFNKSYKYAKSNFDKVFILSAKHHLLEPRQKIKNYDKTLNNMSKNEVDSWARKVANQLQEKLKGGEKLFFLAGKKYYESLLPLISFDYEILMEGKSIGPRLHWLNEHISDESKGNLGDWW